MTKPPKTTAASLKESAIFFKNALLKPKQVGYVLPSSRYLIRRIATVAQLAGKKHVVELGPGTGGTTRGFLAALPSDGKLLAIDINRQFIQHLQKDITDPRLTLCHDSAERLPDILRENGWSYCDAVVSGIPFSTLPGSVGQGIIQAIHDSLCDGGIFMAYQLRDNVSRLANPVFGKPVFRKKEVRNFPPMRLFVWQKQAR